jgi:hypothetical protein
LPNAGRHINMIAPSRLLIAAVLLPALLGAQNLRN